MPTPTGHPCRPGSLYQWKIQHIDHLPVQECRITPAFGQKGSNLAVTVIEQHPVEHTVDNITQSPGHYERQAKDEAELEITLHKFVNKHSEETYNYYTEDRKYVCIKQFDTESHTRVFGKIYFEPREYVYALIELHVCLDQDFHRLVEQ